MIYYNILELYNFIVGVLIGKNMAIENDQETGITQPAHKEAVPSIQNHAENSEVVKPAPNQKRKPGWESPAPGEQLILKGFVVPISLIQDITHARIKLSVHDGEICTASNFIRQAITNFITILQAANYEFPFDAKSMGKTKNLSVQLPPALNTEIIEAVKKIMSLRGHGFTQSQFIRCAVEHEVSVVLHPSN